MTPELHTVPFCILGGKKGISPIVLLASTTWWSGPAKLAISLADSGCVVEAICPPDHPFFFVTRIAKLYPYRLLDSLQSLLDAVTASSASIIVPCDDGAVWQLHALYWARPELRPLIEFSLGKASYYSVIASREQLIKIAMELGIKVPETHRIATTGDLRSWFSEPEAVGVLKLDGTSGGRGVRMVYSLSEAEEGFAFLQRPATLLSATGRWITIKDSLALWNFTRSHPQTITLQRAIDGRPANAMFVCSQGTLLAIIVVEVVYSEGLTGAAIAMRPIRNIAIEHAAEQLARHLSLSGFHGLDFVIEKDTGDAYMIELNPRCTQLGHLKIAGQGDLVGAFCKTLGIQTPVGSTSSTTDQVIALFPQAFSAIQHSDKLRGAYLDVPWGEPRLVRELARRDWRKRTLGGRLLALLRPTRGAVCWEAPAREKYFQTRASNG